MHELRLPEAAWGAALLRQNADLVVRCDGCDGEALAPPVGCDPLQDRLQWPLLRCVFLASCRGHMRREWLN